MNRLSKTVSSVFMAGVACVAVAYMSACSSDSSQAEEQGTGYTISVTSSQSIPDGVSVRLVSTSGKIISERPIAGGKTQFDVADGEYIVTLVGVPLSLDFTSQVVTTNSRRAVITLSESAIDSLSGKTKITFTAFAYTSDGVAVSLPYTYAQLCDDANCFLTTEKSATSVLKFSVPTGSYDLKIFEDVYAKAEKACTVSADERMTVISLSEKN